MMQKAGIAILLGLLAFCGMQGISGAWSGRLVLLPTPSFGLTMFSLSRSLGFWRLRGAADFAPAGWVWQEFGVEGGAGPLDVEGVALFGPLAPDFLYGQLVLGTELKGVKAEAYLGFLGPGVGGYAPLEASAGAVLKVEMKLNGMKAGVIAGFGASIPEDGFTIHHVSGLKKTYPVDPRSWGSSLTELVLSLEGLSLYCGLSGDLKLSFSKTSGFERLKAVVDPLFELCCGILFTVEVELGVDYKMVSPKFTWEGLENCITVWGDLQEKNKPIVGIDGFKLHAVKFHCEFTECSYLEIVEAFDATWYNENVEETFELGKDEDEYIALGFCGPGCCSGTYLVKISAFFLTKSSLTLFGMTRLIVETKVPLMENFFLGLNCGFDILDSEPNLSISWEVGF